MHLFPCEASQDFFFFFEARFHFLASSLQGAHSFGKRPGFSLFRSVLKNSGTPGGAFSRPVPEPAFPNKQPTRPAGRVGRVGRGACWGLWSLGLSPCHFPKGRRQGSLAAFLSPVRCLAACASTQPHPSPRCPGDGAELLPQRFPHWLPVKGALFPLQEL